VGGFEQLFPDPEVGPHFKFTVLLIGVKEKTALGPGTNNYAQLAILSKSLHGKEKK